MSVSTALSDRLSVGDFCRYKEGFKHPWRTGTVNRVDAHEAEVQDEYTARIVVIRPGQKGKVYRLHGLPLVAELEGIPPGQRRRNPRYDAQPSHGAQLLTVIALLQGGSPLAPVVVTAGGHSRPVHRRRKRTRDGRYEDFVRSHPCCCGRCPVGRSEIHHAGEQLMGSKPDDHSGVPLSTKCHLYVEAHLHLEGWTKEETDRHFLKMQVALLTAWAAGEEQAEWAQLRRVAAGVAMVLVMLCSAPAWAAAQAPAQGRPLAFLLCAASLLSMGIVRVSMLPRSSISRLLSGSGQPSASRLASAILRSVASMTSSVVLGSPSSLAFIGRSSAEQPRGMHVAPGTRPASWLAVSPRETVESKCDVRFYCSRRDRQPRGASGTAGFFFCPLASTPLGALSERCRGVATLSVLDPVGGGKAEVRS